MPLPKPSEKESKQDFVGRFMADEAMRSEYPDEKQRAAIAYKQFGENCIENGGEWTKSFKARFIEPGLVRYNSPTDPGEQVTLLVRKEALDKMAQSFKGKPFIHRMHKDVDPSYLEDGKADGVVSNVWYNADDGWYWAEFLVWDPLAMKECANEAAKGNGTLSVSCAYIPTEVQEDHGSYHNIPFDGEIKNGEYTHLASVPNPRYEGAYITNSKGGSEMKLKFWAKKKDAIAENAVEGELDEGMQVEVGGAKVLMSALIEAYNAKDKGPKELVMEDGTLVKLENGEVPLKDLKAGYLKLKENEKKDEDEKEEKEKAEKKNAEEKAEKEKKDKEKEDEEKRNSNEHFQKMKEAAAKRGGGQIPSIRTRREMAAVGSERYGTGK